ncbi:hypothetical protein HWV62_39112 [Athelia sp. TMB]|nr:hypothetical protein HWV62_39112 [Athelia sp. TMB]
MLWTWLVCALLCVLIYLYIAHNDRALLHVPPELSALGIARLTPGMAREAMSELLEAEKAGTDGKGDVEAGFLGGWIVVQLLERGEKPENIRIIDLYPPTRLDLTTGAAKDIQFAQVDVTDSVALLAAFLAPWPASSPASAGLTVFHTAANIRFYEKHPALLPRSLHVNAHGTQNVVDATRKAGASVLVYTSSASVQVKRTRFLLWPWETAPANYVQVFKDGKGEIEDLGVSKGGNGPETGKRHEEYFSNYAASKAVGERLVRCANGTSSGEGVIKTGCLRPANGVFGPGGDMMSGAFLKRGSNPTWVGAIVQNLIYVKNAAHAHLCYEASLLSASANSVSGQAFTITDPNPPLASQEVNLVLSTLASTRFPAVSPTIILLVSHVIEWVYLARALLILSPNAFLRALGRLVPEIKGEIVNLQPSLFNLAQVHLVWDDSRARELLGYAPRYTTLRGLCETVRAHENGELSDHRSWGNGGGGNGFGGLVGAERAVEDVGEKLGVL